METFIKKITEEDLFSLLIIYGGKLVTSIVALIVGLIVINYIQKILAKGLEKTKIDKSLESFFLSITKISLKLLLFIIIANQLGVKMTVFATIIGSAGLAVGLALQGSLSNFAGGVLILLLKPFKVGDYIEAAGHAGTVSEIQVFYTVLKTPDNRVITIPNGNLSNTSSVNYSAMKTRRVDLTFGVGYEADINKVKSVLMEIVNDHKLIMKDPEPFVRVSEHGDSAVNFVVRVWCSSKDYWTVHFDLLEIVKIRFDKEGINIPYPHMDVTINKSEE